MIWMLGVLLLEEAPRAHQRAGRAEPGDEVRDLGNVTPDLGSGALVVGARVGVVAVLIDEAPLGVLVGRAAAPAARRRSTLLAGGQDHLGAHDLEHLAALDRHALGQQDLDRVSLETGDRRQARCRCCPTTARGSSGPGSSRPSFSAASIIDLAMRSFTEPNGFCISSLARMRTLGFGERLETSTIGVLPIRSSTLACTALIPVDRLLIDPLDRHALCNRLRIQRIPINPM